MSQTDESAEEIVENNRASLGVSSWILLFACTVVPPVFATAFTRFEDVKTSVAGILLGAVLFSFGGRVVAGKKVTVTAGKIVAAALVFALYAIASIMWAPVSTWGAFHLTTWLVGVAAFLAVLAPDGRPIRFAEFSVAVGLGTAACGVLGVLDLLGAGFFTPVWDPVGSTAAFDAKEFARPYYAITLPLLAAGVWRNGGLRRIICALGLGAGAFHFGLMATWPTLGIAAGAVAFVTLVVLALQRFQRFPLILPAMVLFTVALLISLIPLLSIEDSEDSRYATALPRVVTETERMPGAKLKNMNFASGRWESVTTTKGLDYAMGTGFALFREQPVFGQGPGGWWAAQTRYPDAQHPFVDGLFEHYPALRTPHNSFMHILTELGGAGVLLLLVWLTSVFGVTFTALATREETEAWLTEHWGLTAACFSGVVFAFFTPTLELAASALIWFTALGLLARESAMLNSFKGLSSTFTLNAEGRRYDVVTSMGLFPAALGLGMIAVSVFALGSNYHRGMGDHLMLRGKYADVDEHYLSAESWWSGRAENHYNIAIAKKRSRSLESGADAIKKAAELRPDDARMLNLVALLELSQRKLDDCKKSAAEAISRFPNFVEARRTLAVAYDLSNDPQRAAEELEDAIAQGPPKETKGRLHREAAVFYMGPVEAPGKAVDHLEKALANSSDDVFITDVKRDLEQARAAAEMQRMIREGKAVPEELRKKAEPSEPHSPFGGVGGGHEGHDH